MMSYIKLIRPKHWIKNLLVFIPLIFSGLFFQDNNFLVTFQSFICFSLVASSIYIINDIKDVEKDKLHAVKKNRPLPAGKISIKNAYIYFISLLILTIILILIWHLPIFSIIILVTYFILNLLYSWHLKDIPIIDILILVSGFVLRILYGASILEIEVSSWMYLTFLALSFYLGLGKRKKEIGVGSKKTRKVLEYYNAAFLDKNMTMFLGMTIIFYALWTTTNPNNYLILTVPLVIVICMKYSLNLEMFADGDPVSVILNDKLLLSLGLILILVLFIILYI